MIPFAAAGVAVALVALAEAVGVAFRLADGVAFAAIVGTAVGIGVAPPEVVAAGARFRYWKQLYELPFGIDIGTVRLPS